MTMLYNANELATALDLYTDPSSPGYDPVFDAEIRRIRPDWFDDAEEPSTWTEEVGDILEEFLVELLCDRNNFLEDGVTSVTDIVCSGYCNEKIEDLLHVIQEKTGEPNRSKCQRQVALLIARLDEDIANGRAVVTYERALALAWHYVCSDTHGIEWREPSRSYSYDINGSFLLGDAEGIFLSVTSSGLVFQEGCIGEIDDEEDAS